MLRVDINEAENTARVVVPDHQLSLAIGREGQNARLAARLTGWKIDIKSESRFREMLEQEILARFTAAAESAVNESEAQEEAAEESEPQSDAAAEPTSERVPEMDADASQPASADQTD